MCFVDNKRINAYFSVKTCFVGGHEVIIMITHNIGFSCSTEKKSIYTLSVLHKYDLYEIFHQ